MGNLATVFLHGVKRSMASLAIIATLALSSCAPSGEEKAAAPPASPGNPAPSTPAISGTPGSVVQAGMNYQFTPVASDADGKTLTFQVSNMPAWATFNTSTGRLSGIPAAGNIGTYSGILITVTDGVRAASLPAFSIQVTMAPNQAPTISGVPVVAIRAGMTYSFQPVASDPEGRTLTFLIQNMPAWMTFNQATGLLTGTPGDVNAGVYTRIAISVSDGALVASLPTFDLTVTTMGNNAPVISGVPGATVQVGQPYSFTPTASDPDGDPISFAIQNAPAWAAFNSATGRLNGTPTAAGTHTGILISVSDGQVSRALPAFSIVVSAAANRAPTISGTPATTAPAGQPYLFTPAASDADGNTLTFSIQGLPAWASFSTSTGVLSGSPVASDAGTYSGIVIRVTDGQATTSLASFTITVTQAGNGTAVLTWTAPTLNVDGSALADLSAFTIYYGTNPSALARYGSDVPVGNVSSTVAGLSSGTWYFALTAKNASGVESARTNVVSKVVP